MWLIFLAYQLTATKVARRCSGVFKPAIDIVNSSPAIPSFLREKYQSFYPDLPARLKVDFVILDYNYTRLNKYIEFFIYERVHIFSLRPHEIPALDENEYSLALEFFLQFDSMYTTPCRIDED